MRQKGKLTGLLAALTVLIVVVAVGANWGRLTAWWEFRQRFESLGKNDGGLAQYRHVATDTIFVLVPGGEGVEPFLISNAAPPIESRQYMRMTIVTITDLDEYLGRSELKLPTDEQAELATELLQSAPFGILTIERRSTQELATRGLVPLDEIRLVYPLQ